MRSSGLRAAWRTIGAHRRLVAIPAAVAAACGVAGIVIAATNQVTPPEPPSSAAGTVLDAATSTPAGQSSPGASAPAPGQATSAPLQLPRSKPVFIDIPAIGVHSEVFGIGKTEDGRLKTPPPGPHRNDVAWYKNSPTPGQLGPSVLEGHIDTLQGPSVFFQLGAARPGDTVSVTRGDGRVAVFTVNAVRTYPTHQAFPTRLVYGARGNIDRATLRLITCDNFNHTTGQYKGNTIVFAHLTGAHPSTGAPAHGPHGS